MIVDHGSVAETAVRLSLLECGLRVLEPVGGKQPYDLVVPTPADRFITVQVKHGRLREGCVLGNTCSTGHGRGRQTYAGRADVLAISAAELRQSFVVPVDDAPRFRVSLRLEPARNGQTIGVRLAADHALEAWVARVTVV